MSLKSYFWIFVFFIAVSCQKDVDEFVPLRETAVQWPEVLYRAPIVRAFDAGVESEVMLPGGTVLTIPAHSFVDGTGTDIDGTAYLVIRDVTKKSDLIFFYLNSNLDDQPVINHHSLMIKAYADTKPAYLKSGQQIYVRISMPADTTGKVVLHGRFDTPDDFAWEAMAGQVETASWTVNGQVHTGLEYEVPVLEWIGLGTFMSVSDAELRVSLRSPIGPEGTKVYFVFKDTFAVVELKQDSDSGIYTGMLPDGSEGDLVVIQQEDESYRFVKMHLTVDGIEKQTLDPAPMALDNIVLALNAL